MSDDSECSECPHVCSFKHHSEKVYCAFSKQAENNFMNSCSAVCRVKFREDLLADVLYSLIVLLYHNDPYDIDIHCEVLWENHCIKNGIEYIHDDEYEWYDDWAVEIDCIPCPPEPDCPPPDDDEDSEPEFYRFNDCQCCGDEFDNEGDASVKLCYECLKSHEPETSACPPEPDCPPPEPDCPPEPETLPLCANCGDEFDPRYLWEPKKIYCRYCVF